MSFSQSDEESLPPLQVEEVKLLTLTSHIYRGGGKIFDFDGGVVKCRI